MGEALFQLAEAVLRSRGGSEDREEENGEATHVSGEEEGKEKTVVVGGSASRYYKSVDQESSLFLTMDSQTSSPVGPAA